MKTFKRIAAQGDFIIMKIDELPEKIEAYIPENGTIVVAHSETGHNHVMEADTVDAFRPVDTKDNDLYDLFLVVKEPTEINHLRSFDTHEALLVNPGNYHIRRQREYVAEGFRRAAD